jgi:hypothetical protein
MDLVVVGKKHLIIDNLLQSLLLISKSSNSNISSIHSNHQNDLGFCASFGAMLDRSFGKPGNESKNSQFFQQIFLSETNLDGGLNFILI